MQRIKFKKIVILQERGENMKNRQFVNFILLFFILFFFLFLLTGCSSKEKDLKNKVESEIKQLEDKIIAMMNNVNKISFSNFVLVEEKVESSDESSQESSSGGSQNSSKEESSSQNASSSKENSGSSERKETSNSKENSKFELKNNGILSTSSENVDWDSIKSNIEIIYSTWPTTVIDLHGLNVKNEDILNFSSALDQVTMGVKQEDKISTLNNLASLYAFLPNYRSQISDDNKMINIDYTKACVLNSYALVEQDKWEEMKAQISNAINYFSNIMNSIEGNGQSQSRISKIYVLLNELSSSVDLKDKDLYYIKYRNVMEELINF